MRRHAFIIAIAIACAVGTPVAAAEHEATLFPVPRVALQPGDTLADHLVGERRLIAGAAARRAYYTTRDAVVGKVARRALPAGAAIALNAVRDAYLFKEGERVTLELASRGLSIRGAGVALQPGSVGQSVRVRNIDTGVIVSGVVKADGAVEVGG
jgi:flagella basal body P-ring formation protein FlgA